MLIAVFLFIFGLIIGSFLNAVIYRLKTDEQFVRGRSKCPHCRHFLGFWDLVPIFSFIFLKGKCRYCQKKISWQYPLVELATGLIFLIGYLQIVIYHPLPPTSYLLLPTSYLTYLIFSCFLIIIFVYDLKQYLILDKVTVPALIVALAFNFLLGQSIINLLIASLLTAGFFFLQFVLSGGKWIGGGDLRLGLVVGAMVGWPLAIIVLLLAYLIGSVVGIGLMIFKKAGWKSPLPFGTFLSLATWIVLLWGKQIWSFLFP